MDKYHFKDKKLTFESETLEEGFNYIESVIANDLEDIKEEELIKTLGVLHFIAKRRSRGNREYLTIVGQYVGERIGSGMRVMTQPPGL